MIIYHKKIHGIRLIKAIYATLIFIIINIVLLLLIIDYYIYPKWALGKRSMFVAHIISNDVRLYGKSKSEVASAIGYPDSMSDRIALITFPDGLGLPLRHYSFRFIVNENGIVEDLNYIYDGVDPIVINEFDPESWVASSNSIKKDMVGDLISKWRSGKIQSYIATINDIRKIFPEISMDDRWSYSLGIYEYRHLVISYNIDGHVVSMDIDD